MERTERQLPIGDTISDGKLAIGLHLKLLATLHDLGKIDDGDLDTLGASLIAELPGVQERFEAWSTIEMLVPDYKRPESASG